MFSPSFLNVMVNYATEMTGGRKKKKKSWRKLNCVPLTVMQRAIFRLDTENTLKKRLISISKGHPKTMTIEYCGDGNAACQPAPAQRTSGQMRVAVRVGRPPASGRS